MRTIKFLGLAVALAAVSVAAGAQGGQRATGMNDFARFEARQFARQQMHQRAMRMGMRGPRMGMRGQALGLRAQDFAGQRFGARGARMGMQGRMMAPRGASMGLRGQQRAFAAGRTMGYRAGVAATPAQRDFFKARVEQRKSVHAQVTAGKLTREQARTQMQAWIREHRPR
ncbi:MAG: hypothetical protein ACYC3L_09075 [Gemmatimonadaceae bacterium]